MKRKASRCLLATLLSTAGLAPTVDAATYIDLPLSLVRDHAFTSDGYLIASSGNRLVQYDLLECTMNELMQADRQLMGVDVSADDEYLAVAASGLSNGKVGFYYKKRYGMRDYRHRTYTPVSLESGSFMPAWTPDNRLLITGMFAGSGWVPMREFNPADESLIVNASVLQNSMLDATDSSLTGIAEYNISSGPLRAWHNKERRTVATVNTTWFVYEVAVNPKGSRYVVPTYNGAFIYDLLDTGFVQVGLLGQYADNGPVGAVFSPDGGKLLTANWSWNTPSKRGLKMYDGETLELLATLDAYNFPSTGNHALGQGRLTLSRDGHWLAATISNGIRLYDVSEELTGTYLGGCATQTPGLDPIDDAAEPTGKPPFDYWGWPEGQRSESTR